MDRRSRLSVLVIALGVAVYVAGSLLSPDDGTLVFVPRGGAARGAEVRIELRPADGAEAEAQVRVGRFGEPAAFTGLRAGALYEVTATAPGRAPLVATHVASAGDVTPIVLRLERH